MNNPIVRIIAELLIVLALIFAFVDVPKQNTLVTETESASSFCDCERDSTQFRAIKLKYNLTEEQYNFFYNQYTTKTVEVGKLIPPIAVQLEYCAYASLYLLVLVMFSWAVSSYQSMKLYLPITDLLVYLICMPFNISNERKQKRVKLNTSTFASIASTVNDINKFLKG